MKSRKFYGSVSRHVNATRIFQHIKLQSSLPSQEVLFSNSLTDVLSTTVAQEQVLRRVEVPVQNDWESKWAPGQVQQLLINPWHLLGSIHQLSFRTAAQTPNTCRCPASALLSLLWRRCWFFLATFLQCWGRDQLLSQCSPVTFSLVSHTVLQTPETKITKGDFLGTLCCVYGFTDLKSGYS